MSIPGRALLILFAVIFGTVLLAGVMLSGEILFRLAGFGTQAQRDSQIEAYRFHYHPYFASTLKPGELVTQARHPFDRYFKPGECELDGVRLRVNAAGFRGRDFSSLPERGPGEIRIVLTGGSTAQSWGIGEACTLDRILETRLSAQLGRQVQVFNLAGSAWRSFQELAAVQLHGRAITPNVVVSLSGLTDFRLAVSLGLDDAPAAAMIREAQDAHSRSLRASPLALIRDFRVIAAIEYLVSPDSPSARQYLRTQKSDPVSLDSQVDRYVLYQRMMARAAATFGAIHLTALEPKVGSQGNTSWQARSESDPDDNAIAHAYGRAKAGLAAVMAAEPNLRLLDLSEALGARIAPMTDGDQFGEAEYELIADRLTHAIAALIGASATETP